MSKTLSEFLPDENATVAAGVRVGRALAGRLDAGMVIYLNGVLGAGKTTFCRGVLQAFGHQGPVKSPTYTLVEPYQFANATVYHFDLYRLGNAEELEFMGIRDYFQAGTLCIVEWPERGEGYLPQPDVVAEVTPENKGRRLQLQALTEQGQCALPR